MLDNWRGVLGLRGTGSHSIKVHKALVPEGNAVSTHLYDAKTGHGTPGSKLHRNPMYAHRPLGFFDGEIASIANGIAWAAIDEFERIIKGSRTVWPLPPGLRAEQTEYQRVLGLALGMTSASHAAIMGGARQFMEFCRRPFEGGAPFSHVDDLVLYNHQGHAGRLAYAAVEHLVRMSGSSNAVRSGQRIGALQSRCRDISEPFGRRLPRHLRRRARQGLSGTGKRAGSSTVRCGMLAALFGQIYGEDTHDIWLKALMDYGWLGFASWAIMVGWTIAAGFKLLFRDRPWQGYLLCAYVVFVGHVFLGTIIDTDHWRHFYLLLGMVWGCIALENHYQRGMIPSAARRPVAPIAGPAAAPIPASRANRSLLAV